MKSKAQIALFASISAVAIAGVSGLAWACTVSPAVSTDPRTGAAGTKVTIAGSGFADAVPVDIRWNTAEGSILGSAIPAGHQFAVEVEIPASASPGVSYLVALQPLSQRAPAKAADIFEVNGPVGGGRSSSASALGDQWRGFRARSPDLSLDPDTGVEPGSLPLLMAGGFALASVGAIALFASLGVALATRREPARRMQRKPRI